MRNYPNMIAAKRIAVLGLLLSSFALAAPTQKHSISQKPIEKIIAVGQGENVQDDNNPPCLVGVEDKVAKIAAAAATGALTKAYPVLTVASPLISNVFQQLGEAAGRGIRHDTGGTISMWLYPERHATCGVVVIKLARPLGHREPIFTVSENKGASYFTCVHKPGADEAYAGPNQHFVSCHYSAWIWGVDPKDKRFFAATYKNWSHYDEFAKVTIPR